MHRGGARLYDRYREAVWEGNVVISGEQSAIHRVQPFGGPSYNPEDQVEQIDSQTISFRTRTSGDFDGMNVHFDNASCLPREIHVSAKLGGYVKIGNVLDGNPHVPEPCVEFSATIDELAQAGGKTHQVRGGAELFVRMELVPDMHLPRRVSGKLELNGAAPGTERAVFVVARECDGGKVVTSPIFLNYV